MKSPFSWWNENKIGCRVGLLRSGRFTSRGRNVDRLGDAVTSAAQRAKCHLCRDCIVGTSGVTSVVLVRCVVRITLPLRRQLGVQAGRVLSHRGQHSFCQW